MDRPRPGRPRRAAADPAANTEPSTPRQEAVSEPKPPALRAVESAAELLHWLTPPTPPTPPRASALFATFLPCCPCTLALDGRACTPRWCVSYRYLDWLLTICVVLVAAWGALVFSVGPAAVGPGSPLFATGVVVMAAYATGWGAHYHLNLPPTVGMLSVALVYRNIPLCWDATGHLDPSLISATKSLIFTLSVVKAGLYFEEAVFHKYGLTIVLLGVLPCLTESLTVSLAVKYLFDIPTQWALTLGFVWGGVSPVLLSLCMVSLSNQGYGTKTGILSILLASATLDNNVIIIAFDVLGESIRSSGSEVAVVFARTAMRVFLSICAGCTLGLILASLPNRYSPHALLSRFLLLIMSSGCVHLVCSIYGLDTAAFVCNFTTAAFMVNFWRVMEWTEEGRVLREVFEMLWHCCQPIMVVLIGISVNFADMDTDTVWKAMLTYGIGLTVRFPVTYFFSALSRKPPRQRLFIAVAYSAKGLLQTTLGALLLETLHDDPVLSERISTSVSLVMVTGTYVLALSTKFLGPLLLPKSE